MSNRAKKLDDSESSRERCSFRARKIPKSHKVPFMVYHSTKNLTNFNRRSKDPSNLYTTSCKAKIVAKTPYEELGKEKSEERSAYGTTRPKSYTITAYNSRSSFVANSESVSRNCAKESTQQHVSKVEAAFRPEETLKPVNVVADYVKEEKEDLSYLKILSSKIDTPDLEESKLSELSNNDQLEKFMKNSFFKTKSQQESSFDSKETISVHDKDGEESPSAEQS